MPEQQSRPSGISALSIGFVLDFVPEVVLDPSETGRVLDWKAAVGFEETIRRMLAWYDAHGVSTVYSHLSATKT